MVSIRGRLNSGVRRDMRLPFSLHHGPSSAWSRSEGYHGVFSDASQRRNALGSLLVPNPEAGNVELCAITMALKAMGALPEDMDDCRTYCGGGRWIQRNTLIQNRR